MKKMKRLAALFLAVVMVMAMGMTAMAAGEKGSITVKSATNGSTYSAYKIFDGTASTGSISYTATGTVKNYMNSKKEADGKIRNTDGKILFTIVDNGTTTYVNVEKDNEQAAAQWIQENINKGLVEGMSPEKTTDPVTNKVAVLSDLAYGYYYVVSSTETNDSGSAVMLTSVNGNMEIVEKHGTPGFGDDEDSGKKANKETVAFGETIKYTVNYKKALNYVNGRLITKYTIEDNLEDGIELIDGTLVVKVNGTAIDDFENTSTTGGIKGEIAWATVNTTGDRKDDVLNYPDAPSVITVEYEVLVTDDFEVGNEGVENTVTIGYVTEDGGDPTTDTDTETVYSGKVEITKVDSVDKTTPLSGAVFVIQNENDFYMTKTTDNDGNVKIDWTENLDADGNGVVDTDIYQVTTDSDGKATFEGLKAGTYKLVEIVAPEGYNLMTDKPDFTLTGPVVGAGNNVTVDMEGAKTIENSKGAVLPSTGGIGTTIFYVVGGILVLGAGVLLITKKRMSARD